ncbi:uncharacterized protein LOC141533739 [Cotesia typhae]|uniref:uncharacterized protein LOC141533739 n=1 Tax=Cotesia typhae TaxID=2053667 RepID=UPI003D694ADE
MRFLIVALAMVAVASAACLRDRCGYSNSGLNKNDVKIGNYVGNDSPGSTNMVMNNVKTNMNNAAATGNPWARTNNLGINRSNTDISNDVGNGSPGSTNMVSNNVGTNMNNRA